MDGSFAAFVGISAVVIMTPGQDTALTIRNTLLGGRPAGVATAVGVAVGQGGWTLAASLGLGNGPDIFSTLIELQQYNHRMGLAFRCDSPKDVDATFYRVVQAGFKSKDTAPYDAFWGQRYASVFDPDGNAVDLFAELPQT